MKIARFVDMQGDVRYGIIDSGAGGAVDPEGNRYGLPTSSTVSALPGEPWHGLEPTGEKFVAAEIKLLAPVKPPDIIAIGLNYKAHADEFGDPYPTSPVIFLKATSTLCGPEDAIILPAMAADEVDYEAELVIVIGQECHDVAEDEALDYVLGYTCGNDVSARDCQIRLDRQWARGKSFDTFCPLGPWIETELDPDNVSVQSRLNGRLMQDGNTSDLIFPCAKLVSYISQMATLRPGTVIMTGTPSGVGYKRQPPVFLRPGDVIEIAIGGIGTLRNCVAED
jgi:2-keto-4-pentenoate hydratase/2-oxohepta-3-ene-1,7-dioic acid hydratase in catechol pathway